MLSISHALPEDNEFTRWLALCLAKEGFSSGIPPGKAVVITFATMNERRTTRRPELKVC